MNDKVKPIRHLSFTSSDEDWNTLMILAVQRDLRLLLRDDRKFDKHVNDSLRFCTSVESKLSLPSVDEVQDVRV